MTFRQFDSNLRKHGYNEDSRDLAFDHCTCNGCEGNDFCEDCSDVESCEYDQHKEWQTRCWQGVCGKCTSCNGGIYSCEDCGQKDELGCVDDIQYHFQNRRDYNDDSYFANYLLLAKNVSDTWDESFFKEDVNKNKIYIMLVKDMIFNAHQIELQLYTGDSAFIIGGYSDEIPVEDEQNNTSDSYSKENLIKDQSYYMKVLDLPKKFTKSELRKRYLEKSSQYHPDKVNTLGSKLKKLAEDEMVDINNAYDELKQYCTDS